MRAKPSAFLSPGILLVLASCSASNPPDVGPPDVDPCAEPANAIVAENCLAGAPATEWDINGWGDPSIQGFGHDMSISSGETIRFKVLTDSDDYRLDVYRMGYYDGMGARLVDTVEPSAELPQEQPDCLTDPATRLYDCGNWAVSASWQAPADATSGIYFARLVREDPPPPGRWQNDRFRPTPQPPGSLNDPEWYRTKATMANALREPRASHIYFVVRDDDGGSEVLFQTSDMTWQAYNRYGGHSVYGRLNPERPRAHGGPPRAYKVSYNRPFETRDYRAVNLVFNSEYPMVRWLERNGYDVSYATGIDSHRRGEELLEHRLFLSVGHDEYWSGGQRRNVEAARAAGVNLAFFSGNEVYWKVRWEDSIDPEGVPFRTLVTYKETQDHAKIDPLADVWTGTFADGRAFNPEGPWPENALTGTLFSVNAWRNDPLIVPAEYARLRFWRDTEVADLARPRMGLRRRQRVPARRPVPTLGNHDRQCVGLLLSRVHMRFRDGDAPPGDVPARERSAGVRLRYGAVAVGPRCPPRHRDRRPTGACERARHSGWRRPARARPDHPAGDGEPVCRHGRPAGDAARRTGRRRGVHRLRSAHRRRRDADAWPNDPRDRTCRRDGHRRRRGRRRGSRSLVRRGHALAPGERAGDVELRVGAGRRTERKDRVARHR